MRAAMVSRATRALVLVVFLGVVDCGGEAPACDAVPFYQCSGGVVSEGGCNSASLVSVARCAKGCIADGAKAGVSSCPADLCHENFPKSEGDACQTDDDCRPTKAITSDTMVTNVTLTCDTTRQACVVTAPPTVADWMKPCSQDVVARIASEAANGAKTSVTEDPGCAEGWCAFVAAPNSCVTNGCTRLCTGDQDCPSGSTCEGAFPYACPNGQMQYCLPGGPAHVGFSCS